MTKKNKIKKKFITGLRQLVTITFNRNIKKINTFFQKKPQVKKYLSFALGLLTIFILFLSAFLFQVNQRFETKEIIFKIGTSETTTFISYNLKDQGLIPNIIGFRLMAKLFGIENKFHVGEYKLSSGMNLLKIMNTLQEKGALSLTSGTAITIPEGYSIYEIADLLQSKGICKKTDFLKLALSSGKTPELVQQFNFLKSSPINSLEGYLFPDTYILPQNASPNLVLEVMLTRFAKAIKPYQREIASNDLNLHQMLTLASIIEKEAMTPSEREIIAGIFKNRLKFRMYLGSCPTVKYAMGLPHLPYLLYKHLNTKSPYNTYRHIGLPPGPIANPGLPSILAALHPTKTEYLYFVSKGNGTHIFTKSLKEHLEVQQQMSKQTGGKIF